MAEFWNVPGRDIPVEAAFGFRNADDYEKVSMPERDALAAYNRVAPPGPWRSATRTSVSG